MLESNRILALIWLPISDSPRYFSYHVSDYEDSIIVSRKYFSQTHYQNTFCIIYVKLPFLHFNYTTPNHFSSLVFDNCKQRSKYKNKKYMSIQSCIFPSFLLIALASLKSVFHFNSLNDHIHKLSSFPLQADFFPIWFNIQIFFLKAYMSAFL